MATPITDGLERLQEGAMAGMPETMRGERISARLPYAGNYADCGPEEMPEIARGVIMLRGVIDSVRMKSEAVMRAFAELHIKLNPALDMREKAKAVRDDRIETRTAPVPHGDETVNPLYPASPLGLDLLAIQNEAEEIVRFLERAEAAIENAASDIRV